MYQFEVMANGFVWVRKMGSGLQGVYNLDGTYRHGDLRLAQSVVLGLIGG
jgi:hypothetical protein